MKKTVKKLKLKGWVKTAIVIIGLYTIFTSVLLINAGRIEKIENDDMILVNVNQMDR